VATEDIAAAPPEMRPPSQKLASLRGGGSSRVKSSAVTHTRDPLFDVNDVPLPKDPDKPKPTFRY
jgi:hypothetical protein